MNIQAKLEAGNQAFLNWKTISFEERQQYFVKMAEVMRANVESYATTITNEMYKPITQSIAEINKTAGMLDYYANCPNVLKSETIKTEFNISEVHHAPMGIILGVMPWNFPFWQVLRFAVPAILAGNVVVLKHASICFGTGNAIEKLFLEAGFPKAVFQNFEVGHKEIQEILENPYVKGVSLTGSGKAGGEVASIAGKNIKKSVLELGGSDAYIVLDDADILKAAKEGPRGKLQNTGQVCNAAKRFLIQKSVEQDFLAIFLEEYRSYVPGDPMDKETRISKMARKDLADDLVAQYEKALANGAEVIIPLVRVSDQELTPGVIKVETGNPILQEELFGPLAMVMVGESDEELLTIANDIPFGLGNAIWTKNKERAQFFIDNLESGTVSINKSTSSDARLPFGGAKQSGYGVELSTLALKEFTITKTVVGNI
ncbi:aldehyde dehydrogenase family protein [Chryseobacterium sp. POL2]|uniref:aldehyde dehydrogenase family protein n=1 Tax=Chryseobacterium sp. POL2 TaxID=2713414 RepID=UPI0013E10609|nr:aldehyde dehydrogenase family protein [Chryseobacterium sp. POL2]QIG89435.1 aldehyde dehydrogenase family protein [Chryseobacterium sp. POL2]